MTTTPTTPTATAGLDRRGRLLKAAVVIPDLTISGLITLVTLAAMPAPVGAGVFVGLVVASIAILSGRVEGLAVRALHIARRPTTIQAARLDRVRMQVATRAGLADLRVLVSPVGGPVAGAGRRHVVLHQDVLDAHQAGRLTDAEIAGLIAHGVGLIRVGQPRLDLLIALWTMPWELLRGLISRIGQHLAWIPLVQFAWQTRFVVGTIAVILEAQAGHWPLPIVIAAFITISYLMPKARQAWHHHINTAAAGQASDRRTVPGIADSSTELGCLDGAVSATLARTAPALSDRIST